MKIYFKPLILTTFSACISASVVTPVDAKVCFLADGRCNDQQIAPMVVGEICDFTIKETDCPSPKVLSTDYCTRSGIRLYESCTCPAEYQYDNTDEKYDYSNQCDDKYEKKICKAEYKYVASTTDVSTLDGETFHSVQLCKNNSVLDTSSEYCDEVYNGVNVRRYKSCKCDTSVYNYIAHEQYGYSGTVFKKGAECSVPGYASAFSTPSCTGNKIGEYYYRQSCNADTEVEVDAEKKTWRSAIGSSAVTCRACRVKSCTDVGGSSYPIKGYRLKNTTLSNGNVCYTKEKLCQPGDYAIKGGYCYNNISDVTENMEKDLNALHTSKNYKLGVVTKATKQSDTKVVLRVVAEKDAHMMSPDGTYIYGTTGTDAYTASSPTSITHLAYDTDTTNWGIMTNDDVDAILDNTTVRNRVFSSFKGKRSNLFAMKLDQTATIDGTTKKACHGSSRTKNKGWSTDDEAQYAYADVYQCYWVKHNSDSKIDRAVITNVDDSKGKFTGIASKSNKWPRYSNGPHIYMRRNTGFDSSTPAYQSYVWYGISANQTTIDKCSTVWTDAAKTHVNRANSTHITLEDILYGRLYVANKYCGYQNRTDAYIPLTYGVRYYEETDSGLIQRAWDGKTEGSKWPQGVQPWRIGVMYGGECSDKESRSGACRDSGDGFYCRMRMYWHGSAYICPYELYKNGSKEPTERCFGESLNGSNSFYYVLANRYANWDYRSKSTFNNIGPDGKRSLDPNFAGYEWTDTTNDYYKTGVQGCFVRPAVELTLDAELGDKSSGSLGSTFQPNWGDYFNKLGEYNKIAETDGYAYETYLTDTYTDIEHMYNDMLDDITAEEEAEGTTKSLPDDLKSSLLDKYKNMFRNSEDYKAYQQKFEGPVIDMQGGVSAR